jgi:hypothetical protein
MINPKSSLQAFALLFVYCFVVFMSVSIIGVLLGAVINFLKGDLWKFGCSDITGLIAGALIYTVFATVGIWFLSRLNAHKAAKRK